MPHASPAHHHASSGRMLGCNRTAALIKPALRRASSSVAQWETHVGAMNKLVSGAITLPEASAFWSRSRVGALLRIHRFQRAETRLRLRGVDCPRPGALPPGASPKLRACAAGVRTDLQALSAARTAIATWRRHVRAMNMLRMGDLSPTAASRMWVAMWHRGQDEIDTYRTAARRASAVSGCPALSTS